VKTPRRDASYRSRVPFLILGHRPRFLKLYMSNHRSRVGNLLAHRRSGSTRITLRGRRLRPWGGRPAA
jgi:hypothetical protein